MTLKQAEYITDHVAKVFAVKGTNFFPRSQLQGYSFTEISQAFALMIAKNRQIAWYSAEMKVGCDKYADIVGALIASFQTTIAPDADVEKIAKYQPDSAERKELARQIFLRQLETRTPEREKLLKEETSISFNAFCWTLVSEDPLYWQKVYSHIGLPYDENCPIGTPKPVIDGVSCSYEFETVRMLKQHRRITLIFWILCGVGAVWLIWKIILPFFK